MPPLLHRQAEAGGHRRTGRALRAPVRPPQGPAVASPEQRAALLQAKLRALVAQRWGPGDRAPAAFPAGAALVAPDGSRAWVLVDVQPERGLGGALGFQRRHAPDGDLDVIVDPAAVAGVLARRAAWFTRPPAVWSVSGRDLVAAPPAPLARGGAESGPRPELGTDDPAVEVVTELGRTTIEVKGLEVARVAEDASIEVGVGRHDREAHLELGSAHPPLAEVIARVLEHRRPGAPAHPANQLARERWMRWQLKQDGVVTEYLAPLIVRDDLRAVSVAPARDGAGRIVVCSAGVDVDLVPAAADVRSAYAADDAPLVLAVYEGDDLPLTRDLAARLVHPAEILVIPRDR